MNSATFAAPVLTWHKDAALEVPFDPAVRWNLPLTRLQVGRWGHRVEGRINELRFETAIVPRGNGFFLLLPPDLVKAAELEIGATVRITVRPKLSAGAPAPGGGTPVAKRVRSRRGSTR